MRRLLKLPEGTIRGFLRDNRFFFSGFLLLLLLATIGLFLIPVGDEIFWLNRQRTPWYDLLFLNGTRLAEEELYLILAGVLCFVRYRTAICVPLIGISVFVISAITKLLFSHERPAVFFERLGRLDELSMLDGHTLNNNINSFPSGHTMSAFALYGFIAFSIRDKRLAAFALLLLAAEVAVSRMYLMQHFLKDIYLGAILGVLIGAIWYYLQFQLFPYPSPWLDNSVLRRHEALPPTESLPAVEEELEELE